MSFCSEREIKSVRKARRCAACRKMVEVGSRAIGWAGTIDGDFSTATFHVECRVAEIELNKLAGNDWDEWMGLDDAEADDWPWLLSDHPVVAARLGITQQKIDENEAEQARLAAARQSKDASK